MKKSIIFILLANIATSIGGYLLANHFIEKSINTLISNEVQATLNRSANASACLDARKVDQIEGQLYLAGARVSNSRIVEIASAIADSKYIDQELLIAIMRYESMFDPEAVSSTGARGLMQIMPVWLKECNLKDINELHDIRKNIQCGIVALNTYIGRYKNLEVALVAYNMGDVAIQEGIKTSKYAKDILTQRSELRRIRTIP